MAISDWHIHDRPREKLLNFGAQNLSDAELLAIFLRVGTKGQSAVDLAQSLLDYFGNLHSLLNATEDEFCQAKGLGQAKFVQLKAVLEMSRRHFESELSNSAAPVLDQPDKVAKLLMHQLGFKQREQFGVLLLNQQHQLIEYVSLFEGTLNQATIHTREVIKSALDHHAAAVILAHNHPSGDPTPSQADIDLTRRLHQALELVEIRCLDHIIIGSAGRWHALSQTQQMPHAV